ncbi:SET domain-containing protein [Tieghemostelium lacteum]|uniref:SET domain-containing protein n=1 Tax=Tieghemostelium lacteum TaxID=361077 RepID=A0A151Z2S7_TIELA|nr:SET domain-containing protein [Tieghemostelium lacteum]|eukprot:KYQ88251.1 SET domain-containing protein [Tieghemostelium lacteum]
MIIGKCLQKNYRLIINNQLKSFIVPKYNSINQYSRFYCTGGSKSIFDNNVPTTTTDIKDNIGSNTKVQAGDNKSSLKFQIELDKHFENARAAFNAEKYEEALTEYYWIIKRLPFECTALQERSMVLLALGRYDEAIEDCDEILKISNDANQIAETYNVKGTCWMKKSEYKRAISAFERSLMMIDDDKEVLELKRQCEALLNPDELTVPSYEDDSILYDRLSGEMMGNAQIRLSSIHGRGIFATKDIDAEELVFETRSIVSVPMELGENIYKTKDTHHCFNCHISMKPLQIENENEIQKSSEYNRIIDTIQNMTQLPASEILPLKCPHCNDVIFCSDPCMDIGMLKHRSICSHKHQEYNLLGKYQSECAKISDEHERSVYYLMLKIFSLESNAGDAQQPFRPMELDQYLKRLIYALPDSIRSRTNIHIRKDPNRIHLTRKDKTFYQIIKDMFSNRPITQELWYRVKSIIQLNALAFPTCDISVHCQKSPMDELGYSFDFDEIHNQYLLGIIEHASFLNHSCEPNLFIATPIINDKSIRFCSSRPIKKGEELFISYIQGEDLTKVQRNQTLFQDFGFECTCKACKANKTCSPKQLE